MSITYKVKEEADSGMCCGPDTGYRPRVYLDTSAEMVKALEVGQQVKVVLSGTITGINVRDSDVNPGSFDLQLDTITLNGKSTNPAQDIVDREAD